MNYFYKDNEVVYFSDLQILQGHADSLMPLSEQDLESHLNPVPSIEQLALEARAQRDSYILDIRWRIERHHDQVALGLNPAEPIEPILQYVQALRDVPQQEGFPEDISWPEEPKEPSNED